MGDVKLSKCIPQLMQGKIPIMNAAVVNSATTAILFDPHIA